MPGKLEELFRTRTEQNRKGTINSEWNHAYLVTDVCCTPKQAMEGYIKEMRKWVAATKRSYTSEDIIPVNVPATPEEAERLEKRLDCLQFELLPQWFVG